MGYVKTNHSKDGNLIYLKIRSKYPAKIVQLPFLKLAKYKPLVEVYFSPEQYSLYGTILIL